MLYQLWSLVTFGTSTIVIIRLVDIYLQTGLPGVTKATAAFLVALPGIRSLVKAFTQKEVQGFLEARPDADKTDGKEAKVVEIPEKGNY